jgi:hypothetical protein
MPGPFLAARRTMPSRPPPCLDELDAMTAAQITWDTYRDSVKATAPAAAPLRDQLEAAERAWRDCIDMAEAAMESDRSRMNGNPN